MKKRKGISFLLLLSVLCSCNEINYKTNYKEEILLNHYNDNIVDGKIITYQKPLVSENKKVFFYEVKDVYEEELNKIFFELLKFEENYTKIGSIILSARENDVVFFKKDIEDFLRKSDANYAFVYKLHNVDHITDYKYEVKFSRHYYSSIYNKNIYYMIFFFIDKQSEASKVIENDI